MKAIKRLNMGLKIGIGYILIIGFIIILKVYCNTNCKTNQLLNDNLTEIEKRPNKNLKDLELKIDNYERIIYNLSNNTPLNGYLFPDHNISIGIKDSNYPDSFEKNQDKVLAKYYALAVKHEIFLKYLRDASNLNPKENTEKITQIFNEALSFTSIALIKHLEKSNKDNHTKSTALKNETSKLYSSMQNGFLSLLITCVVIGLIATNYTFNYFKNLGNGFVFFGSLLFVIPSVLYYLKKQKIPILPMIDVLAIVAALLHAFGRLGCLLAGCCYGKPWDGPFAITFTNEQCLAHPLNTPLHPTQIYSITLLLTILVILVFVKRVKQFDGQIAMLYVILYTFGRSIIEIFRGDEDRGYFIEGYISNSQFIALVLILIVGYFYKKEYTKFKLKQRSRK